MSGPRDDKQAHKRAMLLKQSQDHYRKVLAPIVGGTIEELILGEEGGQVRMELRVRCRDGVARVVTALRDEEGNGPGVLELWG